MATKARQQYDADGISLQKESREFSIADEIQQKIDSIEEGAQVNTIETVKVNGTALVPDANKAVDVDVPEVIDNLYTVDSDNALSAKQGKLLYDYIQNIASRGRFLSNWNSATGLPMTNPSESPYLYKSGDYFVVSNVAGLGGTNYRPDGSSYVIGQASTVVETDGVDVSDFYFYDGTNWLLLKNSGRSLAVDSSLSTTSTNPVENRVITNALNGKQDIISDLAAIRAGAALGDTALQPGDSLSQLTGTADDITEGNTNLFMTTAERSKLSNQSGVNTGDETQTTIKNKLGQASTSTDGYLTSTDWNTFNNKQGAISDLETIRSNASAGKNASDTIATYGDIVTHDANEFATASQGAKADTALQSGDNVSELTNDAGYITDAYHDNTKQDKLIAGANIQIAADGKTISSTDTKYTAGTGISIDANNVISNTQTSAEWGNITGTLSDQTDLQDALDAKQDKLTAGEGIEIGTVQDYSAMRGPCPKGFHVPLYTEWRDLCGILTNTFGLSANWNTAKTYLKLPPAGVRERTDSDVNEQNSRGIYWASSAKGTDSGYAFVFNSLNFLPTSATATSRACSIRPFKDVCVIPDNTWTTLYDGSGITPGAGIFHNSTLGLISISGDGTNRTTIADKNLGAETYWTSGDTLSEANCGKYYQWGNNYGFPRTGSVTTSSTQVDAGTYGPGNYYNSSTFIVRSSSPYNWDNSSNGNLRGGETGVVTLNNVITNTGVLSVNGQTGNITIQTGGNYTAGDGINIDANNEISNILPGAIVSATAPSNPTEGMVWYDTANDSLKAYNGTSWETEGTKMVVLSYGHSTWQDFIDAYDKNAIVYCKASSQSNPGSGNQTRMAFMAYVNSATPTEVEFQYYRSRSDHNTAANQLDQVFVYKLTSASGGTWTVTERNTGAKAVAGTGINLAFGSGNMTISNTGVISVNGNTGAVSVNDTKISSTAPSSPTEGMVWYDTTNDQLKGYDGTNWNVTGKEYNAGEGIEIKNGPDYSAMQGPAPDGFHVPLYTEWQAVYDIWTALGGGGSDGTNFRIVLKLPFAGYRSRGSSNVVSQGSYGRYWSSTRSDEIGAYNLNFNSSDINPQNSNYRSTAFSVRCFKDSPTIPTSTWTKLYGTSIESGGIFWSSTDGLISLSSDGTNWTTIVDKNLGATTVYNDGDVLSEANCGYYYQRGNNYGFPFTGSVTTSGTQVDASAYGPGNYYSSSTFITYNSRWDTTDNGNLWGGETGVVALNNVITNTGVLSVNGQTGDVTIASPDMSNYLSKDNTTAFTPTGDYNPATKKYVDDNKTEYHTGEGISIGSVQSYAAIQGPAPSGFHVPSRNEWVDLCRILGMTFDRESDATTMGTYLKMPTAGVRDYNSSNAYYAGLYGYYWSSTPSNSTDACSLYFASDGRSPLNGDYRANGLSIRCFKDTPIIPTSSWTTLYDGSRVATGAGIFYSATDGLISISGDGQNWYTIQDKNLGATTVYNQGDTLTDANCGYFYQWGNNYGFAHSGTVTTSSTKVDASNYGPGNYYSSNTFITGNDRSSVQNDNLWGGETGVVTLDNTISNTGVLSVNGQTGDVTIPTGIQEAPNSPITGIKYVWRGSEAQYQALSQYYTDTPGDTEFRTYD